MISKVVHWHVKEKIADRHVVSSNVTFSEFSAVFCNNNFVIRRTLNASVKTRPCLCRISFVHVKTDLVNTMRLHLPINEVHVSGSNGPQRIQARVEGRVWPGGAAILVITIVRWIE